MGNLARTVTVTGIAVLAALTATASCGSSGDGGGFGSSGSSGSSSGGSGSSSGAISDDGGSSSSSGGSGSGSGGLVVYTADSGTPATACTTPGATRSCCGTGTSAPAGTETCASSGEFATWGPCLSATGATVSCVPVHVCGPNENGNGCDAGRPPPPPALCTDPTVSTEPQILVGYAPAAGQTVGKTGQIKVWVNDENPPFIAPGEVVDNTTGAITTPGTRTATAADGLLYEPALYIAPQTPTNGGTPHFPQWVKGSYNNNPPTRGTFTGGATIDPPPAGTPTGGGLFGLGASYTGEFIWDVSALGLAPGSYTAVFSVHDGDRDRAIACVNIVIGP